MDEQKEKGTKPEREVCGNAQGDSRLWDLQEQRVPRSPPSRGSPRMMELFLHPMKHWNQQIPARHKEGFWQIQWIWSFSKAFLTQDTHVLFPSLPSFKLKEFSLFLYSQNFSHSFIFLTRILMSFFFLFS